MPWQQTSLLKTLKYAVRTLYMLEKVLQFIREDREQFVRTGWVGSKSSPHLQARVAALDKRGEFL
jgi:hypothetical protein